MRRFFFTTIVLVLPFGTWGGYRCFWPLEAPVMDTWITRANIGEEIWRGANIRVHGIIPHQAGNVFGYVVKLKTRSEPDPYEFFVVGKTKLELNRVPFAIEVAGYYTVKIDRRPEKVSTH